MTGFNGSRRLGDGREIPFDFAQGRLSLRLKNGCARDDAGRVVLSKSKATSKATDRSVRSTRSFSAVPDETWLGLPMTYVRGYCLPPLRGWFLSLHAYPWLAPWAAFCRRFAAEVWRASRGAEAPLFHGTITVRVGGEIRIGIKSKVKIKGNGQECPFHTVLLCRLYGTRFRFFFWLPTAYAPSASSGQAVGCILPPLRGWSVVGTYGMPEGIP